MTKTELLKLIDSEWEQMVQDVDKECTELFGVKDGNLPKNPEWKGWMLGITEGVHRAFGNLYRKLNDELPNDEI